MRDAIAIDLGTANILAYRPAEGIVLNEPSVVAILDEKDRQKILAVGHEAKRMVGRTPGNIRAIRPMRDGVIADFVVAEQLISHVIRKARGKRYITRPDIAISVPSAATPVERRAIREAAIAAGAHRVYLIDEPMAAAIGTGLPVTDAVASMVLDIGGGTTEAAVTSLGGTVIAKSSRTAGDAMDESIMAYLRREYRLMIGEETAERIKITLGSAKAYDNGNYGQTLTIKGRHLVHGVPIEVKLSEGEVALVLSEQVFEIVTLVRECLENVPPELSSDIYDRGLVVTGGGALLSKIEEALRISTGLPISISGTPLEDIAYGAGRALEKPKAYSFALEAE